MFKATRFIYAPKDHADFHKINVAVNRFNGEHLPLVYVQYYSEGTERKITSNQLFHGYNLQKDKPCQGTHFFRERKNPRVVQSRDEGGKSIQKNLFRWGRL